MKAPAVVPEVLAGLALGLALALQVQADEVEEYLQKGNDLYCTHHLAPGRIEESVQWYERALSLRPDEYSILWKLSEICQVHGTLLGEAEKARKSALWEKGIEYGRRAVEVNPDGKEGHFYYMANLGALARLQGALSSVWKFRKIKREMDRALKLDPEFPPALVARAQYLTEMPGIFGGDDQEAMRLYQHALESDPGYVIAYYYMAELDTRKGRYEEAIAKLNKVLEPKEAGCKANWSTIDRPWAQSLLRQILAEKASRE
jgi:tetratricopeptide (TPR) repeat protein